jgi:hypothetical protein
VTACNERSTQNWSGQGDLLERVRDVSFYRRPRTLFKGFRVPDWATSEKRNGW